VLVSGLLSASGPPAWIVEAVLAGELEIALDMAIRQEYEDVLRRPDGQHARHRQPEALSAGEPLRGDGGDTTRALGSASTASSPSVTQDDSSWAWNDSSFAFDDSS
jgi:hypothetical protein